jgi:CBS domain-containing protein/uncharacterized protein (DUF2267 family)
MSLRWYRRPRLVVLNSNSTVQEAARAIEENRIGAVVVQDKRRVVGVVTDRDLAVRALGRGLDAATTKIADVMTPNPVVLTPADSVGDAIWFMQERNVRRIPLVEDDRVVGMVTLDDLILDEAAPMESLTAIVQSQIAQGGPSPTNRTPAHRRSLARAEATLTRMLAEVRVQTGFEDLEQSRVALDIVLASLMRRLIPQEASDLIAQLPSLLQPGLRAQAWGPDKEIDEASIQAELAAQLDVDPTEAARILEAVAGVIAASVSDGQAEHVRRQLPPGLRDVFRDRESARPR